MSLVSQLQTLCTRIATQINVVNTRKAATIAYASSITPNCGTSDIVNVGTLTGTMTINPPSGTPLDGQNLTFRFIQDGTGRVVTFDTGTNGFKFGTDVTAAMLPATPSAKFEVLTTWNAADTKWRVRAIARGF